MVDISIIFEEETPINIISHLKPDIYTKGADYNLDAIPYANTLKKLNIKIDFIPIVKGKSSTNIIKKISEKKN